MAARHVVQQVAHRTNAQPLQLLGHLVAHALDDGHRRIQAMQQVKLLGQLARAARLAPWFGPELLGGGQRFFRRGRLHRPGSSQGRLSAFPRQHRHLRARSRHPGRLRLRARLLRRGWRLRSRLAGSGGRRGGRRPLLRGSRRTGRLGRRGRARWRDPPGDAPDHVLHRLMALIVAGGALVATHQFHQLIDQRVVLRPLGLGMGVALPLLGERAQAADHGGVPVPLLALELEDLHQSFKC